MTSAVATWIDAYVRAWGAGDPAGVGALFTEDARYFTEPWRPPFTGRDAIVRLWQESREPGQSAVTWQPICVDDDVAVVTGVTTYPDRTFSNLWVIRLTPEGTCREFTEWRMEHPES